MEKVFLFSMFAAPMIVLLTGLIFIITIPIQLIINEKILKHRVEKRLKKLQNKCVILTDSISPTVIKIFFNVEWSFDFENGTGFYLNKKCNSRFYNYLYINTDGFYIDLEKCPTNKMYIKNNSFSFIDKLLKAKKNTDITYFEDIVTLYLVSPHELFHKFFEILIVVYKVDFKKLFPNDLESCMQAALFLKHNRFKVQNQPCFISHKYYCDNYHHLMRMIEREVEKYKPSNKDNE